MGSIAKLKIATLDLTLGAEICPFGSRIFYARLKGYGMEALQAIRQNASKRGGFRISHDLGLIF